MSAAIEPRTKITRREKGELKSRMGNSLMFLPNMVKLLGRLIKDVRVPAAEKALFLAAIVYVISPLDFIPDVFPFIGQVDDIYVVALTLLRLLNRTDAAVVRQHWSGGGDIVAFGAQRLHRLHGGRDHSTERALPAGVGRSDHACLGIGEQDRSAIGSQDSQREAGAVGNQCVGMRARVVRERRGDCDCDG